MTHEEIEKRTREIVIDKLGVDENEVTEEADFMHDLGADSLDTVELGMELEQEFNIAITDIEWEKVNTFSEAVALIESKVKK